ncbi:MAG TPA: HD-GYP domain-containing protein [Gemmatales bacterium]|nr:HD-GYP domain-containing protein [Gemmatales bacterium]HMP59506.1 HD-GYP domain-containing protein [Gemmatales bacterium]
MRGKRSQLQFDPGPSRIIPARIAGIYIGLSMAWILASDVVVDRLFPEAGHALAAQTLKGIVYVVFITVTIYLLIRRDVRALERAQEQLLRSYDDAIAGWGRALDLRDRETENHSQRVAEWTVKLCRALGIDGNELVHIWRGALLHDIGKMGLPDAILQKPGPLSPAERREMEKHPEMGRSLLEPIEHLQPALAIPWCHHERWDGSGYPRGLKGQEIPLAARIFMVVDVWDALSSDRPYRTAWTAERIDAYFRANAGKQFDPEVVDVFLDLLRQEGVTWHGTGSFTKD